MEVNSQQVQELHKKFEELNDEISQALQRQEDAIAATPNRTGSMGGGAAPRKDIMKLTTRAIDWREDVNALAKHIDLQLQNSRALRTREAEVLPREGDAKQLEEDDSAKMRCLRSDLRLLQEFRTAYANSKLTGRAPASDSNGKEFNAVLEMIDSEGKQQKELVDKSIKAEKSGRKDATATMLVQLFEARRELMGKISEDVLKDRKALDYEGATELVGSATGLGGLRDKDMLASWDAQLYVQLVQGLLDLEKEMKERFSGSVLTIGPVTAPAPHDTTPVTEPEDTQTKATRKSSVVLDDPNGATSPSKGSVASLDEANFALQKLRRDYLELKQSYAKVKMANAQLEDDLSHLQRKYEDEKRAHMNEKKWYVPKIQKLEETVLTTSKAFEALKLNVELLTNMYKTLRQTLSAHELEENDLKLERDRVTALLAEEIKKVALLTKENVRREKLVTIAMSARHEMCAIAKDCEARMAVLIKEKNLMEQRANKHADELSVVKLQLDGAYSRLEATDDALRLAKQMIERLQREMEVCVEAAKVKEAEIRSMYDKDMQILQQRFDKAKRELMDAMSQNLSLDGRLRKAQEKLNRITGDKSKESGKREGTTT